MVAKFDKPCHALIVMKRFLVIPCLAMSGLAFSTDDAAVRKILERKTSEFVKSMRKKDAAWFEQNATSDYRSIQGKQTLSRTQVISRMKQMFAVSTSVDPVSSTVVTFKMTGRNAVVLTKTHFVVNIGGGPGGKPVRIEDTSTEEETWVPVGKDYKIQLNKELTATLLMNGKPFKPPM